jgi:plasmid maintenance system killer protein
MSEYTSIILKEYERTTMFKLYIVYRCKILRLTAMQWPILKQLQNNSPLCYYLYIGTQYTYIFYFPDQQMHNVYIYLYE